jgi:aryl-alcohol dehydrogenase-like predicted oxidoreductase
VSGIEYRVLGKTGLKVSALGFGGSETGYGGVSIKAVEKILNAALDQGLNVIDTAECYGDGENQIGRAVGGRRKDFVLLTKCGHAEGLAGRDWSPAMLERSIDRSLKRLRTDHVDVMQFHSCSEPTLRDDRVIGVLTRARDAGKTRFIGYSGDSTDAVYAVTMEVFDTLQISVSIADQEAIDLVLPKAHELGMGVIAKRPIANAAWLYNRLSVGAYARPYYDRLNKLDYDFIREGGSAAIATALQFTLSVRGVHTAIVGTTKPERWAENASYVARGALPPEQFDAIRARWSAVARRDWTGEM